VTRPLRAVLSRYLVPGGLVWVERWAPEAGMRVTEARGFIHTVERLECGHRIEVTRGNHELPAHRRVCWMCPAVSPETPGGA
jgi:hypothetical protein